jgi:hypothetical protein
MEPIMLADIADDVVPIVAVGGGLVFGLCWLVAHYMHETVKAKHREQSRREIAAYIAEGSMTPEQGERLMAAGGQADAQSCKA